MTGGPASTSPTVAAPKYWAVKQHLLEIIDTLAPGSAVPTERDLAAALSTSRTTVRQALSELVGDGRLVRRQGSGTFVAEPKISWPLQMISFTDQARAQGFLPSTRLLSAQAATADPAVAQRLGLDPGGPIYRIERLRLADDKPVALETSHLSAARFPDLLGHLDGEPSLYRVLAERFGVTPAWAEETIETASATPVEADLLDTDTGLPMLVLSRHSFTAADEPMEWVRSWYRGDRYTFVARLTP